MKDFNAAVTCTALAAMIAVIAVVLPASARAHEVRPTIVSATIEDEGGIRLRVSLNLEARIAGIGSDHADTDASDKAPVYDRWRRASPAALRDAFAPVAGGLVDDLRLLFRDKAANLTLERVEVPPVGDKSVARVSEVVLTTTAPPGARVMTWAPEASLGDNVFRVTRLSDAEPYFSAFLAAGETSPPIPLDGDLQQSPWSTFVKYLRVGFEHIVPGGLDHILFIIGLFLLSAHLRPLLWQVTSFTLAHSATLGLGIYGLVSVPPAIVEPLIAASIVFVAIENLLTDRLHRWRPVVVFGFGLLHGLGFAGVLAEFGLPQSQFATALVAFNVGVELGQIAVLVACFLGVGLHFRHRDWYRPLIVMPASVAVACIATLWLVERVAA